MRFVRVAEVRQVVAVGHVAFGDQHDRGIVEVDQRAQELDDLVGALIVQRRRARFLPEKRDGVEAQHADTVLDVEANDLDEAQQDLGIAEIEIDLIRPERAPDPAITVLGLHLHAQGRRSGAHDHAKVFIG